MSSSSSPNVFAPRTNAAWLCVRRYRSGSGLFAKLGSSARMASIGFVGESALRRRQSTTPSHRPSQNACVSWMGDIRMGQGRFVGNGDESGTRREHDGITGNIVGGSERARDHSPCLRRCPGGDRSSP